MSIGLENIELSHQRTDCYLQLRSCLRDQNRISKSIIANLTLRLTVSSFRNIMQHSLVIVNNTRINADITGNIVSKINIISFLLFALEDVISEWDWKEMLYRLLFPLETNNVMVLFVLLLLPDRFELTISREAVYRFPIIKHLRMFLSKHRFFHSSSYTLKWESSFFSSSGSFS